MIGFLSADLCLRSEKAFLGILELDCGFTFDSQADDQGCVLEILRKRFVIFSGFVLKQFLSASVSDHGVWLFW